MPRKRKTPADTSRMGGVRQGTPGQAYGNRTDLNQTHQPVTTVPGQTYGMAAQQQAAQQAIPLPGPPAPGAAGPWNRPTERPNEPVTAGITQGAGPGPEALNTPPGGPDIGAQLRGLMLAFPNDDNIRRLVTTYETRQGSTGNLPPAAGSPPAV